MKPISSPYTTSPRVGAFPVAGTSTQNGHTPQADSKPYSASSSPFYPGSPAPFRRASETFESSYPERKNNFQFAMVHSRKAPAMPTADESGVVFIRAPFTSFPDSHLFPNGLSYDLMEQNPNWFLHTDDFMKEDGSNPNGLPYPAFLEPPSIFKAGNKSEGRRLRCAFCRRTYDLTNGRSVWRRHVYENHKIAMGNRREGFHGRGSRRNRESSKRTESVYETNRAPPTRAKPRTTPSAQPEQLRSRTSLPDYAASPAPHISRSASLPDAYPLSDFRRQHQAPISEMRSPSFADDTASSSRYSLQPLSASSVRGGSDQASTTPSAPSEDSDFSPEPESPRPRAMHMPSFLPPRSVWRPGAPMGTPTRRTQAIPISSLIHADPTSTPNHSPIPSSSTRSTARERSDPYPLTAPRRSIAARGIFLTNLTHGHSDEEIEDEENDFPEEEEDVKIGIRMMQADADAEEQDEDMEVDELVVDGDESPVGEGADALPDVVVDPGVVVFTKGTAGLMDRYIDSIKTPRRH